MQIASLKFYFLWSLWYDVLDVKLRPFSNVYRWGNDFLLGLCGLFNINDLSGNFQWMWCWIFCTSHKSFYSGVFWTISVLKFRHHFVAMFLLLNHEKWLDNLIIWNNDFSSTYDPQFWLAASLISCLCNLSINVKLDWKSIIICRILFVDCVFNFYLRNVAYCISFCMSNLSFSPFVLCLWSNIWIMYNPS